MARFRQFQLQLATLGPLAVLRALHAFKFNCVAGADEVLLQSFLPLSNERRFTVCMA